MIRWPRLGSASWIPYAERLARPDVARFWDAAATAALVRLFWDRIVTRVERGQLAQAWLRGLEDIPSDAHGEPEPRALEKNHE